MINILILMIVGIGFGALVAHIYTTNKRLSRSEGREKYIIDKQDHIERMILENRKVTSNSMLQLGYDIEVVRQLTEEVRLDVEELSDLSSASFNGLNEDIENQIKGIEAGIGKKIKEEIIKLSFTPLILDVGQPVGKK